VPLALQETSHTKSGKADRRLQDVRRRLQQGEAEQGTHEDEMAAQPQQTSTRALRTKAEIALFREREEALEAQAKRRLAEAELGHRRLALFERAIVFVLWLVSVALAAIGFLSIPLTALIAAGSCSAALSLYKRRRGEG
jgi:hypothetical protein